MIPLNSHMLTSTSPVGEAPSDSITAARALGAQWAHDVQRSLRSEKRRADGGWPGTMREARSRAAWLLAASRSQGAAMARPEETTEIAKTVYASARSTWRAYADAEQEDE